MINFWGKYQTTYLEHSQRGVYHPVIWDVQIGVSPLSKCIYTINYHWNTLTLPSSLQVYLFISLPPSSSSISISLSLFSSLLCEVLMSVSDAQLTCICLSSWFIFLCHLDISLLSFPFYFVLFFFFRGEMFHKPVEVSVCDLQFPVCLYHLKAQINYT